MNTHMSHHHSVREVGDLDSSWSLGLEEGGAEKVARTPELVSSEPHYFDLLILFTLGAKPPGPGGGLGGMVGRAPVYV